MTEIEKLIGEFVAELDALALVAPAHQSIVNSFRAQMEEDIEKGIRKTYVLRFRKELFKYARNALSSRQFAALKAATSDSAMWKTVAPKLPKVLARGSINSAAEYAAVMEEMDRLLQSGRELSDDEDGIVKAANELLAAYHRAKKRPSE